MRFSSFTSSKAVLVRGAAPLVLLALLSGCASYGAFDENEPGIEESLFGGLVGVAAIGIAQEEEPIDYSSRAPLVAPPNRAALPAPQAQALAANDPQWPQGSSARMAQVLASDEQTLVFSPGVDGVDIAATQALAERQRQPAAPQTDPSRALTPAEMAREAEIDRARRLAIAQREAASTVRGRRFLTDPPAAIRTPAADAPYGEAAQEAAAPSRGWWPF